MTELLAEDSIGSREHDRDEVERTQYFTVESVHRLIWRVTESIISMRRGGGIP